ncbi:DUF2334 domain-containing protein [Actinacidiphila glaucinigra]|uniref:DUF2334 domain-containing protein n=1 Tax=Actinacidiphila glaucinigra TaxID=235986 RepID=UPI0036E89558
MQSRIGRSGKSRLSVIVMLIAALLGAAFLSAPAGGAADRAPAGKGDHRHRGEPPGGRAGLGEVDFSGWAKAQRAADRDRRAGTPVRRAGQPPRAGRELAGARAPLAAGSARAAAAADAGTTALVLYDTAGPYGHLGELYAMATANLAGHFGTVTAKPVSQYTAGMVGQYTATYYIGSTYYGGSVPDAVPAAFYQDVVTTTRPVTWLADNIWSLANATGVAQFQNKYGWDPTASYFEANGSVGTVTQVTYKDQTLTRKVPAGQDGGVLRPAVMPGPGYPAVTPLATARDTSTGTDFPWALRSGNLTYVGEIPFAYVSESDRIIAFQDLLFDSLAPATAERHRAMMRLEDISPNSDPAELRAIADYLAAEQIPYGINVIPVYTDPKGTYNNGQPQTVTLVQRPQLVATLKYMLQHGAVLMNHGYTHQHGNTANPYNGVTGDDFEFYRAHVDASDNVVYDGPVTGDSALWAQTRVTLGLTQFALAGLPVPKLWTTPHYAASATDYKVFARNYTARLERSLYFSGTLGGSTADPDRFIGQFFPYVVKDVYGTKVLPENIGNYEPEAYNNHPARLPADLIASAKANLAVRDGYASFFYHPYYPVQPLKETVEGIRALGYTFVSPATAG